MPSWDPGCYLAFAAERARPARDLLAAICHPSPTRVVDVGCGPGNSTVLLAERWPGAEVIGIDSSEAMIEAARRTAAAVRFEVADLGEWSPSGPVDVVFSNSALQWVDDHPAVLAHLLSWLAPGGVLAVQMPANYDQPSHTIMRDLAEGQRWSGRLAGALRDRPVLSMPRYRDLLAPFGRVDIWTTEYLHVLDGDDPVTTWVSGTGLRPLLDRLDEAERQELLAQYSVRAGAAYPPRFDGKTLFPFRRIFIVVTR